MNATLDLTNGDHMSFYAYMNKWDLPHLENMYRDTSCPILKRSIMDIYERKHKDELKQVEMKQLTEMKHLYNEKRLIHETFMIEEKYRYFHGDSHRVLYAQRVPRVRIMEEVHDDIIWYFQNRIKSKVYDPNPTKFFEKCSSLPNDITGLIRDFYMSKESKTLLKHEPNIQFFMDLIVLLTLNDLNKVIGNLYKVLKVETLYRQKTSKKAKAIQLIYKSFECLLSNIRNYRPENEIWINSNDTLTYFNQVVRSNWFPILFGKLTKKNQKLFREKYPTN